MIASDESAGAEPVIDARGLRCPWPALRAARAMRHGGAFTLIADDPKAEAELAALAAMRCWSSSTQREGDTTRTLLLPPDGAAD